MDGQDPEALDTAHRPSRRLEVPTQHLCNSQERLEPYLQHVLRLAGCEVPLFEPEACQALFQASHGLPRQVNSLAHYALTAAALAKARTVSPEHVRQACRETGP